METHRTTRYTSASATRLLADHCWRGICDAIECAEALGDGDTADALACILGRMPGERNRRQLDWINSEDER